MSIQEEIVGMNQMFIHVMTGNIIKDWMIVGGELEFDNMNNVILIVHMAFAPYSYIHSESYNKKLYTKILENYVQEIEAANDDELHDLVIHLNIEIQDNIDMSVLRNISEGYLKGAHDYQYVLWANNPESEINERADKINTVIVPEYCWSDYFIYEDLALIRAGLDSNISNSIYYNDGTQAKYNSLNDINNEDNDIWSLLDEGKED